jgi:O-antigen/teichoic acid export membrane protein
LACGISVGITLAWFGFGYWSLVGVLFTTSVMNCVLVWTICGWRPGPFRRRVGARGMLAFGGNVTAFNVLNYFGRNFDNILIGRVLGSAPLGIYSKAYGLLTLPIAQINIPMASVMLPGLSRLQNDPSEYARLYVSAVRAIALMTIPIVVFSFFFSRDIVLVLLGRKWLPVAPIFQLLAPAALFEAISFAPGWLCQSLGRTRRQFHYALVSAPIYVTGFVIGIRWGIAGVAVSYSITFSLLFWGYVLYATNASPVTFLEIGRGFVSSFLPASFAGGVTGALRWSVFSDVRPVFALIVLGLAFVAIYVGASMLVGKNRTLILSGLDSVRKAIRGRAKAC